MKTRKQWIAMLLMLAMLFTALPIAAFAEDPPAESAVEEQQSTPPTAKIRKVHVWWHHYDTGKGFYNPADEGQERTFYLRINAEGTNEQGERERFNFYLNPVNGQMNQPVTMKIGDDVTCELNVDRMELPDGKVFTDVKLMGGGVMINSDNRIYAGSTQHSAAGNEPEDRHLGFQMCQNMETRTKVQKETPDEIIMDEDIPFMNIEYWIEVSKSQGERKVVETNRRIKISAIVPFEEKTVDLLYETNEGKYLIFNGIHQNTLNQFNPYTGKYKEFFLCAAWAEGERKVDLDKRYKLKVEGDDLNGWTVTLESKIQFEKTTEEREIPYNTVYEEDPTMFEDQTRIKTHGVKGKEKVTTSRYFIIEENGAKTDVDVKESKETLKAAVDEVILRGTKKRSQKPDRPSVPSVMELVIFDANGGSWANGETRREYRRAVDSVISIESAPTREGYKFLYWKGSEFHPGENYTVPAGGHTFVAQWEKVEKKPEDKPSAPSVDAKIKTPRGSALTAEEIAKILAGSKKVIPAIPKAGVGR